MQPLILFDGVCNLCSHSIQFVIRHDKKNIYRFASLQSGFARSLLLKHELPPNDFETIVLIEDSRIFTRSTAALRIARRLNGAWPLLYILVLVPRFIRDAVYRYISAHRYKWFGKKESCWLPSPELESKFVEHG